MRSRMDWGRTKNKPDKGLMNGSCNRTACQAPLNGRRQFSMRNYSTGGRLYYCAECEADFSAWDRRFVKEFHPWAAADETPAPDSRVQGSGEAAP